jgi:PAS domain S-box-containing protein
MQTVEQILAMIDAAFGGVPPLFKPAADSPAALALLWQQEQLGHLENPLPPVWKEALLAKLAQAAGAPYCVVCHACALSGLGCTAAQIRALLESPPPTPAAVRALLAGAEALDEWPALETPLADALLGAAAALLQPAPEPALADALRRLLGPARYTDLAALLCYARASHAWSAAQPQLDPADDPRACAHLAALLQAEPRLAELFAAAPPAPDRALQTAHARLEALLDYAPYPVWGKDADGRYEVWSRRADQELAWTGAEVYGKLDSDMFPPDLASDHRQSDLEVVARGGMLTFETRFSDGPGARIYQVIKFPMLDRAGRPGAVYGMSIDITARKRDEEVLNLLQQVSIELASSLDYTSTLQRVVRLALPMLADYCAVALIEGDDEPRYVAVAHSDPAHDLQLQSFSRRYQPPHGHSPIQTVIETGKPWIRANIATDEIHRLTDDPETFALLALAGLPRAAMAVPLLVRDQIVGVLMCVRTRSEARFNAEDLALAEELARIAALAIDNARLFAELRRSERRYRTLVSQAADGILLADEFGRVQEANTQAGRLLGAPAETLPGRLLTSLLIQTDGTPLVLASLREGAGTLLTREGADAPREVEASLSLVVERGQTLGIIILRDISERIRAEQARLALERQLRDLQRLESMGLLAGGVAHDFNNMLAAMLGHANIARQEMEEDHPARAALIQIERTARRASELVRQLLVYAGQEPVHMQQVELDELIAELIAILRSSMPGHVAVRADLPPLPLITADAAQIRQVLMNLLINGVEAIGESPGAVTISANLRTVDQEYLAGCLPAAHATPGTYVLIEVRDSGPGIDQATLERIFEPFYTTKPSGRGLGLAAVLGIVRAHHGSLRVESAPGHGTSFCVLLPAKQEGVLRPGFVQEVPRVVKPAPSWEPPVQAQGLILVADSSAEVRAEARRALEGLGFRVLVADNGPVALRLVQSYGVQVTGAMIDPSLRLLNDVPLPEAIVGARPGLPVVLLRGPDDLSDGTEAPALLKPFAPEEVLRAASVFQTKDQPAEGTP